AGRLYNSQKTPPPPLRGPPPPLRRGGGPCEAWWRGHAYSRLRLQFDVPVKIIHPALVQMVGRKQPTVVVQVVHGGLHRLLARPHLRVPWHQPALPEVARRAGSDDVLPGGSPAAPARNHVVEGQILMSAAILALEAVAQEDVEAGEGRMPRGLHIALEADDAGQTHRKGGRRHRVLVFGDDVD